MAMNDMTPIVEAQPDPDFEEHDEGGDQGEGPKSHQQQLNALIRKAADLADHYYLRTVELDFHSREYARNINTFIKLCGAANGLIARSDSHRERRRTDDR